MPPCQFARFPQSVSLHKTAQYRLLGLIQPKYLLRTVAGLADIGKGMGIGDRIRARREQLGMSQEELADAVGMKQQGIQSIEAGNSKHPRKLREIANTLKIAETYLRGETDLDHLRPEDWQPTQAMPVIGEVAAGLWLETGAMPDKPLETLPFAPMMSTKATYALKVRGNSVDKVAPDGSYLICADIGMTGIEINDGDLVIVERRQIQEQLREVTVKRVRSIKGGIELVPVSTDPRWKPIKYLKSQHSDDLELRVIAHVLWVVERPRLPD